MIRRDANMRREFLRGTLRPRATAFTLPWCVGYLAIAIAELLLSHGADAGHANRQGRTAADEAERCGMDVLAQVLRDAQSGSG
jgi:hypothetical protein